MEKLSKYRKACRNHVAGLALAMLTSFGAPVASALTIDESSLTAGGGLVSGDSLELVSNSVLASLPDGTFFEWGVSEVQSLTAAGASISTGIGSAYGLYALFTVSGDSVYDPLSGSINAAITNGTFLLYLDPQLDSNLTPAGVVGSFDGTGTADDILLGSASNAQADGAISVSATLAAEFLVMIEDFVLSAEGEALLGAQALDGTVTLNGSGHIMTLPTGAFWAHDQYGASFGVLSVPAPSSLAAIVGGLPLLLTALSRQRRRQADLH